jgi:hypothetical protein
VSGDLVALLVFKTSVGLNKVPGGFDSHPPPPVSAFLLLVLVLVLGGLEWWSGGVVLRRKTSNIQHSTFNIE